MTGHHSKPPRIDARHNRPSVGHLVFLLFVTHGNGSGLPAFREAERGKPILVYIYVIPHEKPYLHKMNRSQMAYRFSCDRLFNIYPRLYFWTFTFSKVRCDWTYPNAWARFIRVLSVHLYRGHLHGIRVIETHEEHGLHYHAILNQRIWAPEVRRIGKRYGIGRVKVTACDLGAAYYLEKYLIPSDAQEFHGRMQRWGSIGGFNTCRMEDVEMDSSFHRLLRAYQSEFGVHKLKWHHCQYIYQASKRGLLPTPFNLEQLERLIRESCLREAIVDKLKNETVAIN